VDARERWQALQSRLTAARTFFERGDRDQALAEVDAALAIDPSFLAAVALRERIVSGPVPAALPIPAANASPPLVSTDGYARFEQRARRRRVDRKIEAARHAIARRNLRSAASALDEVIELDPNLPELSDLTAAFDELRRDRATSHRGPMIAAAATFGVVLLGATWFRDARVLLSHPFATIAGLVEPAQPAPLEVDAVDAANDADVALPTATAGRVEPVAPAPPPVERARSTASPTPPAEQQRAAAGPPAFEPPAATVAAPTPASVPPATAIAAPEPIPIASLTAAPTATAVDVPRPAMPAPSRVENDEAQIARALQQYRSAYEGLDARRAQAIWPAVNEEALARAFSSLESQRLTFDACRTQLHGSDAVATCQGTARYVPKVGSREPRVEPRTWTFILRKADGDWKIDTARAER